MIQLRTFLLTGLLAGSLTPALAQLSYAPEADTLRIRSLNRTPRWVVSVAPLALFEIENTIQIGVERLLAGRHSIFAEFGYGPRRLNMWRSSNYDESGGWETWRGRAEWRIYLGRGQHSSRPPHLRFITQKPLGRYIAFDLAYKQVNGQETGTIGRDCEGGPCQYYQRFQSRVVKTVWAGHVKLGHQRMLDLSGDNRLLFDIYIGLGLRQRSLDHYGRPEADDAGPLWITASGWSNGISSDFLLIPNISTGLRFGYAF